MLFIHIYIIVKGDISRYMTYPWTCTPHIVLESGTYFLPFAIHQVVSTGPTPEWDEAFAWAFDSPPKGQKLHISCKNKSKLGKVGKQRKEHI